MTITKEVNARDIMEGAWSGARDTMKDLTESQVGQVLDMLEEMTAGGDLLSETDVNDFFWFERDTLAEWLGFADYEALMNANK